MIGDRRAASATLIALSLPILIGFVGLAMDVGMWAMSKRHLQGAVDQAAYSVAIASSNKANGQQAVTEGLGLMARQGYANGIDGVTVAINNPPSTGPNTGDANAWEVMATMPQHLYFASLFLDNAPTVAARAVALKQASTGSGCILSLHTTAAYATSFTNNADSPETCDVYTNSSHAKALQCENNCDIFGNTYTVGGQYVTNHGTLHGDENSMGVAPAANPYADLPRPTAASLTCTSNTLITAKGTSPSTISPGVYCGGIDVASNKTLTMTPGVYYIKTKFNLSGNSVLEATGGVTIVLLGDLCIGTGTCVREKGIGNNVTINLEAPTDGTYAGVALYAVGTGSSVKMQEFSNNVALNIQGAFVAPYHKFSFHNNAQFDPGVCAQVVGLLVSFENNADMGSDCEGTGVKKITGAGGARNKKTVLVE